MHGSPRASIVSVVAAVLILAIPAAEGAAPGAKTGSIHSRAPYPAGVVVTALNVSKGCGGVVAQTVRPTFNNLTGRARFGESANVTECGRKMGLERYDLEAGLSNLTFRVSSSGWRRVSAHWVLTYSWSTVVPYPPYAGDWDQVYVNLSVTLTDLTTGKSWNSTDTVFSKTTSYSLNGLSHTPSPGSADIGPVFLHHTHLYAITAVLSLTLVSSIASATASGAVGSMAAWSSGPCFLRSVSIR